MNRIKLTMLFAVLTLSLAGLAGCGGDGQAAPPPDPAKPIDVAAAVDVTIALAAAEVQRDVPELPDSLPEQDAGKAPDAGAGPATPINPKPLGVPLPRWKRYLYITIPGCEPCRLMEAKPFKALRAAGWVIDETDQAHIQKIVVADDGDPIAQKYGVQGFPTLVLLHGTEVSGSLKGYHEADPISRFFNDAPAPAAAAPASYGGISLQKKLKIRGARAALKLLLGGLVQWIDEGTLTHENITVKVPDELTVTCSKLPDSGVHFELAPAIDVRGETGFWIFRGGANGKTTSFDLWPTYGVVNLDGLPDPVLEFVD